jgi:hypothetical protein
MLPVYFTLFPKIWTVKTPAPLSRIKRVRRIETLRPLPKEKH